MASRRTGSGRQTSDKAKNLSKLSQITSARGGRQQKLQIAGNFVQAELANPGPWIDVTSSRVTRIRYDYGLRAIFVQFPSGRYWVYESTQYAVFVRFLRAASKGQFINRVLNSYPYREALPEEALRPTTHTSSPSGA